jgi:GNAT superfamily N-acetyltransferase
VDAHAVLAAYDEQVRRNPDAGPGRHVERDGHVVRVVADEDDGWSGVVWSDLDGVDADAVIAAQASRFAELRATWEWKYYSYDRPEDLPERLRAAGLQPDPVEGLLVADIDELDLAVPPPSGVRLVPVSDAQGADALVRVHNEVFGGDHASVGRAVLAALADRPSTGQAVLAMASGTAVSAGRVEFHEGTDFASLWGGGTLAAWRGRGVFRSLVAYRAALAKDRGFRYLQVDASADSRPILHRLGFVQLATTTPYTLPDPSSSPSSG